MTATRAVRSTAAPPTPPPRHEGAVTAQLDRLRDAGATEFIAAPVGDPTDRRRTVEFLGSSGRRGSG